MARPRSKTPTPGELEILQVFWTRRICTVREVHEELLNHRNVAATTVASMVQLMHDKGLLRLVHERRPQKYEAVLSPDGARQVVVADVLERLFDNSPDRLVLHLLRSRGATDEQLDRAGKLLSELS